MTLVWQEFILQTKLFFRERQAVFWGLAFPILLLLLFCSVFGGSAEKTTGLVGGIICINCMSGALFAMGVVIVGAREQKILRRYKVAPVSLWKIVIGLCASRLISITITTGVLLVLARIIYRILLPRDPFAMLVVYTVGALMFCAMAFAVAALSSTMAHANGVVQVLFMPMMFLSGATFPYEFMPAWMQKVAHVLPATYYVLSLKSVMVDGGGLADNVTNLIMMLALTFFLVALAVRFFKWE